MLDALLRLVVDKHSSCSFYGIITGDPSAGTEIANVAPLMEPSPVTSPEIWPTQLNDSQIEAIYSCNYPLSLIWGPPGLLPLLYAYFLGSNLLTGTGKTTVVVQILRKLVQHSLLSDSEERILITASTHNGMRQFDVSAFT